MVEQVDKALRGEGARIEALVAGMESRVRRAFMRFLEAVDSEAVRRQVRLALQAGEIEAALQIIDTHVVSLGSVITAVFLASADAEVRALAGQMRGERAAIALSFDPGDPRAAQIMRANQLEFVRQFTAAQREATRAALAEALQAGAGPVGTARAFRASIGLTATQLTAVARYRALLEAGDAAALDRDLRDRRFDRSVARAAETGEPLGRARIDRMVERYRTRYLQYRAETIARTETLAVVGQARHEALRQVALQAGIPDRGVRRTWRAVGDSRTRWTHNALDGQVRGMDEAFVSPSGARMMFPGDRSLGAGPEEIVQCRCVLINELRAD